MDGAERSRRWRIAGAVGLLLGVGFVFLVSAAGRPADPKVVVTFAGFTNSPGGPEVIFTLTNASPLTVYLDWVRIGGKNARYAATAINSGTSLRAILPIPHAIMITEPPTDRVLTNTERVPLPAEIEFDFRRDATGLEIARENLASVLGSVRISVPGLNPDSARFRFQVRSEVPEGP